jgi:hypothetical protein
VIEVIFKEISGFKRMEGIKMLIEVESKNSIAKCPFCRNEITLDEKSRMKNDCNHVVASCGSLFDDSFKVYFTSTIYKRKVACSE